MSVGYPKSYQYREENCPHGAWIQKPMANEFTARVCRLCGKTQFNYHGEPFWEDERR